MLMLLRLLQIDGREAKVDYHGDDDAIVGLCNKGEASSRQAPVICEGVLKEGDRRSRRCTGIAHRRIENGSGRIGEG